MMKNTKIKLKLTDRLNIIKYVYTLKCTLAVRLAVDTFVDMIQPTDDEMKTGKVTFDQGNPVAENDFAIDFDKSQVPEAISDAIKSYLAELEMASKTSEQLKKTYDMIKSTLGLVVDDE